LAPIDERATVIVCDGDEAILDLLCEHLSADNFEVLASPTGSGALRFCRYNRPDVMVLDLSPPDMPGVDIIERIREADGADTPIDPNLAILVLTDRARGRLLGMDAGADDFLAKPFSYEELKGRIDAVLRRRHKRRARPIRVGDLLIDEGRRKVTVGDRDVRVSKREFALLQTLASDPTRVFDKAELMWVVWGRKVPSGRTRTLDSHASRLRSKLDPEDKKYVQNTWGVGYSLLGGDAEGDSGAPHPRLEEPDDR
jgi:DNA-binding response OmpR family regulator